MTHHRFQILKHVLSLSFIALTPSSVLAYDHFVSGVVIGSVRVHESLGFSSFARADQGTFPGCSQQPGTMWSNTSTRTVDGSKALLSTLLMAKATRAPVTIYYTTTDGYCRVEIIDLE